MINAAAVVSRFSDNDLERALQEIMGPGLSLSSRVSTNYMSTHPIEMVSVVVGDEPLDLMCKYSASSIDPLTGHERGVAYEAEIYRRCFPHPNLTTPTYFGRFQLEDSVDCIVLQRMQGYRAGSAPDPRSLIDVCADLGAFHSVGPSKLPPGHNVFNSAYFSRIMSEAELYPGVSSRLAGAGSTVVNVLANGPRALIHGELYPSNVLITDEGPVVIDWESAGAGPGVLDLAVLTQGSWDSDLVDECEEVYWKKRGATIPMWGRKSIAAARIMAAGLLLLHLMGGKTDTAKEQLALETIALQVPRLES